MITIQDYFGLWHDCDDVTPEVMENATQLLTACSLLESMALADGVEFPINPQTGNGISGKKYGGFRPQQCTEGAPKSAHKSGQAVDRYDPYGRIDQWCMKNLARLEECGIYLEHPNATPGWSHWSIRPCSKRVFFP